MSYFCTYVKSQTIIAGNSKNSVAVVYKDPIFLSSFKLKFFFSAQEIISAGTLLTRAVAFLLESITSRPRKGVTVCSLVIVFLLLVAWNYATYGWSKFLI